MKTLILTVGLPRCGKSTWAKKQKHPIVNPDSIRSTIHGQPFYAPAEPLVWATAKIMVQSLFGAGHDTVVLDATNITQERRNFWVDSGWKIRYKKFYAPPEICVERALANKQDYLVPVIWKMHAQFEPV